MKSGRNESSWGKSFMGKKNNYSSPNSTNPNPNLKQSKQFELDVPLVKRVSGCSKSELKELRRTLELELQKVRSLNDRIESGGFFGNLSGQKRGNFSDFDALMKMCKQILTKLMRSKTSRVFSKPVDAVGLGLYDYHQIVKKPMDLGTVKMNLGKNAYASPSEFASDVRLTFDNAMLYNPNTDQVHLMAAQLLSQFEDMFAPVQHKLDANDQDDSHATSWNQISRPKKPKTNFVTSIPPEPLVHSTTSNPSNSDPPPTQLPLLTPSPLPLQSPPSPLQAQPPSPVRAPDKSTGSVKAVSTLKQPKPKAKDANKRPMTLEEKQKLGVGLQSLPEEKMPQLVQIIRKRNERLAQEGDEIELDIEALDTETLWELDRFVTNWKKLESKTKRQALMDNFSAPPVVTTDIDEAHASDIYDEAKNIEKGDGDGDVDIGDEMRESSSPRVGIEKDGGGNVHDDRNMIGNDNAGSSSSSSGSSGSDSSSGDSDSGSHSGSDSDPEDEVQS